MTLIDCITEDDRWQTAGLAELAERAGQATLQHLALDPAAHEISLMGCDDSRIATLNTEFRDKPKPTNVLSWPADDLAPDEEGGAPFLPDEPDETGPVELGDIAIAWETCSREATDAGLPFANHVCHLIVHGILHLLGYDHVRDGDAELMEAIEVEILGKLGVPDPYNQEAGQTDGT